MRVLATANMKQMKAEYAALTAQVEALNAQQAAMVNATRGVDPKGYQNMTRAAKDSAATMRAAVASTGMFEVSQMRLNNVTDDYISKLQAQKMSFRELRRERDIGRKAFHRQLAMENMLITKNMSAQTGGRSVVDVFIPKAFSHEVRTAGKEIQFFSERMKSGSNQLVNWGKNVQWQGRQMMVGLTLPMAAAGAAAGVLAYQMDREFTRIRKVYDLTADEMDTTAEGIIAVEKEVAAVRQAGMETAIKSAREYGFAATDTLQVQAELAATGIAGNELQESTNQIMRIARLGEFDYQDAVKTTIALQTVFKQSTEELAESFDYMNAIENSTSLQTEDFAAAIPIAAAPIKAFGGDIKELGTLLTAMRSQGIEATQGANAIKAAMQRLGRPSKQIRTEWEALTGTDITEIFQKGKNLTDIFQEISRATDDLSDKDRIKAFAGLFGTYQVTRMTAMTDGLRDMRDATTQVGRAFEIANNDAATNAAVAEKEIKAYQESVSGQWETTFNEMKAQLSTLGEPFVVAATSIIRGVTKIIEAFQGAPKAVQIISRFGLVLGAAIGPIVMLTGLIGNMIGTFGKGIGTMAGLFARFLGVTPMMTTAQKVAEAEMQMHKTSVTNLTSSYEMLTAQINAYSQAVNASASASQSARGQSTAGPATAPPPTPVRGSKHVGAITKNTAENAASMSRETEQVATMSEKAAQNWKNIGTGLVTALPLMGLVAMSGDGLVNSFAKVAMYAALLGPSLSVFGEAFGGAAKKAKLAIADVGAAYTKARTASLGVAAAQTTTTAATTATAAAATGATTRFVAMGAAAKAGSTAAIVGIRGIMAAIGPVGWAIAAIGGAYAIWTKVQDSQKKAAEEQKKLIEEQKRGAEAIARASDNYAAATGKAVRELRKIQGFSLLPYGGGSEMDSRIKRYESDELKDYTGEFRDAGSKQDELAMQHFVELQLRNELSAAEAALEVKALYIAAGSGAAAADAASKGLLDTIGNINRASTEKKGSIIKDMISIADTTDKSTLKESAENIVEVWSYEMQRASSKKDAQELADALTSGVAETVQTNLEDAFKSLPDTMISTYKDTAEIDVLGRSALELFREDLKGLRDDTETATNTRFLFGKAGTDILKTLAKADEEPVFAQALADAHALTGEYKTIAEVLRDPVFRARVEPFSGEYVDDIYDQLNRMVTNSSWASPEDMFLENPMSSFKWDSENREQYVREMADIALANGVATDSIDSVANGLTVLNGIASGDIFKTLSKDAREAFSEADRWRNLAKYDESARQSPEYIAAMNEEVRVQRMINDLLQDAGMEEGDIHDKKSLINRLQEMFNRNLTKGRGEMGGLANDASRLADAMQGAFNFTGEELARIKKSAMEDLQQEVADWHVSSFETRMNNAMDANTAHWDKRQEALSNDIERKEKSLDSKWEVKMEKAEAYWDRRAERIDKAIEAEEKAEEKRKKMFDAEIARINKLNEMANTNIDFNVALNTGDLDEAARIRNSITAKESETALERAANAGTNRSNRKIDRLNKRGDTLKDERDEHMKSLKKQEEREREHLRKRSKMRENALAEERKANEKAYRENWEKKREANQKESQLLMTQISMNEKQFRDHAESIGVSLEDFERDTIEPKSDTWGNWFGEKLKEGMKFHGQKLANDKMWENIGKGGRGQISEALGFNNWKQLRHFMKTGEIDESIGRPKTGGGKGATGGGAYHSGGMVGKDKGSRVGVARTLKGLHSSERMINAQDGEFLVNRRAAAKNEDVLRRINRGEAIGDTGTSHGTPRYGTGGPGSGGGGVFGMVASVVGRSMLGGIQKAVGDRVAEKQKQVAAVSATFAAGKGGMFGDRSFNAEQLKNAAIIANVGRGMGMSARDIKIGIMTAIAESGLINVNYGDRDSLGLFQQRPSMGWGTPEQVTNPEYAARAFFGPLKGLSSRGEMSPWMAAQTIQRSAFSDGSNYRDQWDSAQAIFQKGLKRTKNGNFSPMSYAGGKGGWSKPVPFGRFSNTHDIGVPEGTPVFAVGDGRVAASTYITSGGSGGNGRIAPNGLPYRSYGEMIKLQTKDGLVNYGHLQPGSRIAAGTMVKGGAQIARSGNTGNSTGPHLHLDIGGNQNAKGWLAARGISLRKGAANVNFDNTLANLHKGEAVLTRDLNAKFHEGVNNFANGGNSEYHVHVNVNGTNASADEIATIAVNKIKRHEARKPSGRKN